MEPTVHILMATYNGEKYLKYQLDSIVGQTYANWTLVVQDDSSTDRTWELLQDYAKSDSRITVKKSPEKRHGPYYNFHSLANQEKKAGLRYDYYIFSDQDDLWDNSKLETMVSCLKKKDHSLPQMVYGDMRVIDENESILIDSISRKQGLFFKNEASLFFCHNIYGCNMMMNAQAFFSVPIIDTSKDSVAILSHDNLYTKFTGILGQVTYLDQVLMSYRRHGGNVTAVHQYGFGLQRILRRAVRLNQLARDHARTYNQSLEAIDLIRKNHVLSFEKSRELTDIEKAVRDGGSEAMRVIYQYHVDCGNRVKNLSHFAILYLGIYRKYLMPG